MTRDDLLGLLAHDNVQAFLRVLRAGETNQDGSAYTVLFGGGRFDSVEDHPRARFYEKNDEFIKNGKKDYTTAAGAYQIVESTWDPIARQYGLNDFGPTNQDIAAVALIHRRGALEDVIAGRFDEAVRKCNREWASLPGSPYGQPTRSLADARKTYREYGGCFAEETRAGPVVGTPAPTVPRKGVAMPAPIAIAAIQAFLPAIVGLIPKLGSLFGSGSEVQQRNVAAASMVGEAIVAATGAPNLQAAVERMQDDPECLRAASAAIDDLWPVIGEAGGGGIKAARDFAAAGGPATGKWTSPPSPQFILSIALLGLVYMAMANITGLFGFQEWTAENRSNVLFLIVGTAIGAVTGFWFGTSHSSQRKDQLLGSRQ